MKFFPREKKSGFFACNEDSIQHIFMPLVTGSFCPHSALQLTLHLLKLEVEGKEDSCLTLMTSKWQAFPNETGFAYLLEVQLFVQRVVLPKVQHPEELSEGCSRCRGG